MMDALAYLDAPDAKPNAAAFLDAPDNPVNASHESSSASQAAVGANPLAAPKQSAESFLDAPDVAMCLSPTTSARCGTSITSRSRTRWA